MDLLRQRSLPQLALGASLALLVLVLVAAVVMRSFRADDQQFVLAYLAVATPWVLLLGRKLGRARPEVRAGRWLLFSLALAPALWAAFLCGSLVADHGLRALGRLPSKIDDPESLLGVMLAFFYVMSAARLLAYESRHGPARGTA